MSKRKNTFRELVKYRAGALCLIGILSATFLHTTTFMAQFFYDSLILGAIAAFAVDAGVVAMAIFKDELIMDGELAWMVRIVTATVLFASGIANMSEGFLSAYGMQLTYESLLALDPLIWAQWLAGTVIFPILSYVMCDTVGTRNLLDMRKSMSYPQNFTAIPPAMEKALSNGGMEKANKGKKRSKQEKQQALIEAIDANPEGPKTLWAAAAGVTSAQMYNYLKELELTHLVGEPVINQLNNRV